MLGSDPFGGKFVRRSGRADPDQGQDGRKNDTTDDLFFHSFLLLKMIVGLNNYQYSASSVTTSGALAFT